MPERGPSSPFGTQGFATAVAEQPQTLSADKKKPVLVTGAAGLVGIGHVSARSWMSSDSELSRDEAVQLAAGLAWRGIGGFPIHAEGEE